MKTHDLITVLTEDNAACRAEHSVAHCRFVTHAALALLIVSCVFLLVFGLRTDWNAAGSALAIMRKHLVVVAAAVAALVLAWQISRPVPQVPRLWMLPPVVLAALIGWEWAELGTQGWQSRMIGRNGLVCLSMIPLLAALPLAALLVTLRQRAPANPSISGAVAGVAAAALGAVVYALHCTDDSMLFVALWYTLGMLVTAALGAVLGRVLLRW